MRGNGLAKRDVNFINILGAHFPPIFWRKIYKGETFSFVIFWCQNICKKAARKMLVKLTIRRISQKRIFLEKDFSFNFTPEVH